MLLIGNRLAIKGNWDTQPIPSGRVGLILPPAPGVICYVPGNPYSATTRALLEHIDESVSTGTVIDAGCGNGILALAAAVLGAVNVQGYETHPSFADIARNNITANNLNNKIKIHTQDYRAVNVPACDHFLCNIDDETTLVDTVAASHKFLRPGGTMICVPPRERSGVVEAQAMVGGLSLTRNRHVAGWNCLTFRRA